MFRSAHTDGRSERRRSGEPHRAAKNGHDGHGIYVIYRNVIRNVVSSIRTTRKAAERGMKVATRAERERKARAEEPNQENARRFLRFEKGHLQQIHARK